MLTWTIATAAFFYGATGAVAQGLATCNGFRRPDWDDCDIIAASFESKVGNVPNYYPGCTTLHDPNVDSSSLNCQITVCPQSAEADVLYGELRIGYSTVEAVCKSYNAGGQDVYDDRFTISVENNPGYEPAEAVMADESPVRYHARDFATKRQQPGDDGFNLLVVQSKIRVPGTERALVGELTAGSVYVTEESTSLTTGVSASVEVGASFFELFSASVSAEVSQDQTSTSAVGINVEVDCDSGQMGFIYWYPLYTLYQGQFTPSGDFVDIWIPDNSATGTSNFGVQCLG